MSRTTRHDNGLNKGRDDKPMDSRCLPDSSHPKGFNSIEDDHGHYGAGGAKKMKKLATSARRNYQKNVVRSEITELATAD